MILPLFLGIMLRSIMISFIQNFLGKHHKWFFSILLVVIIVAFVFTIGNTGGIGPGRATDFTRDFYGINLNSEREQRRLVDAAMMTAQLAGRRIPDEQFEYIVLSRAVYLYLADKYGIPRPEEQQLAQLIQQQRMFFDERGHFSPDLYTQFIDSLQANPNMSESRVSEILMENYRINAVRSLLTGPGYALPAEAIEELARQRSVWSVAVASLSFDDYQPEIDDSDAAIEAFFEEASDRYNRPQHWVVEYVFFPAERYVEHLDTPSESSLRDWFGRNRSRFRDDAGEVPEFDAIRDDVEQAWRGWRARRIAVQEADEFSYTLFDQGIAFGSDEFVALLQENQLRTEALEPFSAERVPSHNRLARQQLREAFNLDSERYYSGALALDDGAAVLLLADIQPEQPRPLDDVRAQVERDYREQARMDAFAAHGEQLREQLREKLAEGEAFVAAAEELGLQVSTYDSFTLTSPPEDMERFVLFQLPTLSEGDLTPMLTLASGGTMVYVVGKETPEITMDDPEAASTLQRLAWLTADTTEGSIISERISRGLQTADEPAL